MNEGERFLRLRELRSVTGLGSSTIWAMIRRGAFPAPVHIGKIAAWPASEIGKWQRARIAERDRKSGRAG
jgi:prophage regulatory protein